MSCSHIFSDCWTKYYLICFIKFALVLPMAIYVFSLSGRNWLVLHLALRGTLALLPALNLPSPISVRLPWLRFWELCSRSVCAGYLRC